MRKIKKLFAIALACLTLAAALSGCGSTSDDQLRADALADILNAKYGKSITSCKVDARLSQAAQEFAARDVEDPEKPGTTQKGFNYIKKEINDTYLLQALGLDADSLSLVTIFIGENSGTDDPARQAIDITTHSSVITSEFRDVQGSFKASDPDRVQVGFGTFENSQVKLRFAIIVAE